MCCVAVNLLLEHNMDVIYIDENVGDVEVLNLKQTTNTTIQTISSAFSMMELLTKRTSEDNLNCISEHGSTSGYAWLHHELLICEQGPPSTSLETDIFNNQHSKEMAIILSNTMQYMRWSSTTLFFENDTGLNILIIKAALQV